MKSMVHERVSVSAVAKVVCAIVQFDGGDSPRREEVVKNKIKMLLTDAPAVRRVPQVGWTPQHVRQAGLE
jgi:hypothetical protein